MSRETSRRAKSYALRAATVAGTGVAVATAPWTVALAPFVAWGIQVRGIERHHYSLMALLCEIAFLVWAAENTLAWWAVVAVGVIALLLRLTFLTWEFDLAREQAPRVRQAIAVAVANVGCVLMAPATGSVPAVAVAVSLAGLLAPGSRRGVWAVSLAAALGAGAVAWSTSMPAGLAWVEAAWAGTALGVPWLHPWSGVPEPRAIPLGLAGVGILVAVSILLRAGRAWRPLAALSAACLALVCGSSTVAVVLVAVALLALMSETWSRSHHVVSRGAVSLVAVAVAACALPAVVSGSERATRAEHWARLPGWAEFQAGTRDAEGRRDASAIVRLQTAIASLPERSHAHADAELLLGDVLVRTGRGRDASAAWERAAKGASGRAALLRSLAGRFQDRGAWALAREQWMRLGAVHRDGVEWLHGVASTYEAGQQWREMGPWIERALACDPEHVPTLVLAARRENGLGHARAALDLLEQAIDAGADDDAAVLALAADVGERVGDASTALQRWRRVTELEPELADAWIRVARVDLSIGDHESARRNLERALESDGPSEALERARAWLAQVDARSDIR